LVATIYFAIRLDWAAEPASTTSKKFGFLLEYTALNSMPLLGFRASSKSTALKFLFGAPEQVPHLVTGVAMFQTLLSFVWLFLLFLGIRNYFKLK
jgi:hypothetical protein